MVSSGAGRAGSHMQALEEPTHQLAVHGGYGQELHGEAAGERLTHNGRRAEVVGFHFDAQMKDRPDLALALGGYGEAEEAEVAPGGSETVVGFFEAHRHGGLGSNPVCSPVLPVKTLISI